MKTKKMYTNGEKIKYYEQKLEFINKRLEKLYELNPDDYEGQNWNSDLRKELDMKQIQQWLEHYLETRALSNSSKKKAR